MKPAGAFRGNLVLTAVCLIFGMALMVQLRTESRLHPLGGADGDADLAAIAGDLYDSNTTLREELDQLSAQRNTIASAEEGTRTEEMRGELGQLQAFNGSAPVQGPGIELVVDAPIRPVDLQDLLNEMRNAGAEAISIGNQRVVYSTSVAGSSDQLLVNGKPVARPVVIQATGSPDVLDRALARKGGMVSYLQTSYPAGRITLTQVASLTLPAYTGTFAIRAAN
ncbi:MAG TPA: DUF881 domain-containing protein [Chloroflexota bacterium]|nr:DUF881 domain-containing protein [Chloroflexota bacterium]